MKSFNFNNKKFVLLENSENGEVDQSTVFEYKQKGNLVTADYFGGTIAYGKIIAHINNDELNMVYQCATKDNQLKAGRAIAKISEYKPNKLKLSLDWEWLGESGGKGKSQYVQL